MFTCQICNYNTKTKCNYLKHLKTKKHLNNVKSEEELTSKNKKYKKMTTNDHKMTTNEHKMTTNEHKSINKELFCTFCNKKFSTKAHRRRHEIHYCKENVENTTLVSIIDEKDKELKREKREKKKLYKQIETLLEKVGDTINNNTINQTNNIVLNNYGKEDLSHITSKVLDKLIMAPCQMINNLTRMIHFNDKKPENMNIYIPNKKEKYIKVFKNNQWMLENKKDAIPDIIDKNYFILDSHYENNDGEEKLDRFTNKSYKEFQKKMDEKDESIHKIQYDACELELLNSSKLVIDHHEL